MLVHTELDRERIALVVQNTLVLLGGISHAIFMKCRKIGWAKELEAKMAKSLHQQVNPRRAHSRKIKVICEPFLSKGAPSKYG